MGANTVGMTGATCTSAPCENNDCVVEAARGQTGNVACDMYHTYEEDVKKVRWCMVYGVWRGVISSSRLACPHILPPPYRPTYSRLAILTSMHITS